MQFSSATSKDRSQSGPHKMRVKIKEQCSGIRGDLGQKGQMEDEDKTVIV